MGSFESEVNQMSKMAFFVYCIFSARGSISNCELPLARCETLKTQDFDILLLTQQFL